MRTKIKNKLLQEYNHNLSDEDIVLTIKNLRTFFLTLEEINKDLDEHEKHLSN